MNNIKFISLYNFESFILTNFFSSESVNQISSVKVNLVNYFKKEKEGKSITCFFVLTFHS